MQAKLSALAAGALVITAAVAAPPAQPGSGVRVGAHDVTPYTYDEDASNRSKAAGSRCR
jgi:predicted lipoprotein with Yx(FWY)xxD motif